MMAFMNRPIIMNRHCPEQTSIWLDRSIREPGLSPGNSSRVLPFSGIDMRTGNKDAS